MKKGCVIFTFKIACDKSCSYPAKIRFSSLFVLFPGIVVFALHYEKNSYSQILFADKIFSLKLFEYYFSFNLWISKARVESNLQSNCMDTAVLTIVLFYTVMPAPMTTTRIRHACPSTAISN